MRAGTETKTAASHERAHAELVGQGQGSPVVGFGLTARWRFVTCRDVAEKAKSIGFMAPFLVFTGKRQRPLGEACASSRRPASRYASPRERGQSA